VGLVPEDVVKAEQPERDFSTAVTPAGHFEGLNFNLFKRYIELLSGDF